MGSSGVTRVTRASPLAVGAGPRRLHWLKMQLGHWDVKDPHSQTRSLCDRNTSLVGEVTCVGKAAGQRCCLCICCSLFPDGHADVSAADRAMRLDG